MTVKKGLTKDDFRAAGYLSRIAAKAASALEIMAQALEYEDPTDAVYLFDRDVGELKKVMKVFLRTLKRRRTP